MKSGALVMMNDVQEVIVSKGAFPLSGKATNSFTSFEDASDKERLAVFSNVGEKRLELLANA